MKQFDNDIVSRCQNGQLTEFGQLYDKYIKKIYNFVYFKTLHRETAEDLTSEVFLKALEHISGFDQSKGLFSSWLYRIARNTVIDYYRTKKNEIDIDSVWDASDTSNIAIDLDSKALIEKVNKYLAAIKPRHREILIMRLWDGLTYREIADITGNSETNCKMIFSREINTLRQYLPAFIALIVFIAKNYYDR